MNIAASNIYMSSNSEQITRYERKESLRLWVGDRRPALNEGNIPQGRLPSPTERVSLSDASLKKIEAKETGPTAVKPEDSEWLKIYLIQKIIKALTGRDIKIHLIEIDDMDKRGPCPLCVTFEQPSEATRAGWGLEYDFYESLHEVESVTFKAQGMIKTTDGSEIDFTLEFRMRREFFAENALTIRAGDARKIDPLVVNIDNGDVGLTDKKYLFDLDSDGNQDSISFVRPNSAFLALDLNGDGVINNGKELFGPTTGNGFAELSAYDEDGNGWIDRADPVFSRLLLWRKDPTGNDLITKLSEANIVAIHLGSIDALFNLKNNANRLDGMLRKTGVYLRNNGTAGPVMQIDLVA